MSFREFSLTLNGSEKDNNLRMGKIVHLLLIIILLDWSYSHQLHWLSICFYLSIISPIKELNVITILGIVYSCFFVAIDKVQAKNMTIQNNIHTMKVGGLNKLRENRFPVYIGLSVFYLYLHFSKPNKLII